MIPLRGPRALAIFDPGEGWPMSNLERDGCKHDVYRDEALAIEQGTGTGQCAKCGALIVPAVLLREALAQHDRKWGRG